MKKSQIEEVIFNETCTRLQEAKEQLQCSKSINNIIVRFINEGMTDVANNFYKIAIIGFMAGKDENDIINCVINKLSIGL